MMDEVEKKQPFGSFFALAELPDLPYVEISADAFDQAATEATGVVQVALAAGAEVLRQNGEVWSREVERALYTGHDLPYPLDLS
jgi:hypothetical protein